MMLNLLMKAIFRLNVIALRDIPGHGLYCMKRDALYYNIKPICSLTGLKSICADDTGITLVFEDGEIRLGVDGVKE